MKPLVAARDMLTTSREVNREGAEASKTSSASRRCPTEATRAPRGRAEGARELDLGSVIGATTEDRRCRPPGSTNVMAGRRRAELRAAYSP